MMEKKDIAYHKLTKAITMRIDSLNIDEINTCYKAVADHTRDIVLIISKNFSILYANQPALALFKLTDQKIEGENVFEVFSLLGLKIPINSDYFHSQTSSVVESNGLKWKVSAVSAKNRKELAVLLIGYKSQYERDAEVVNSIIQIMDYIPGSLYWKNKEGRYLGCNKFMVKTAGLKSTKDIIGKMDVDLWPENAEKIRENDQDIMSSEKKISLEEKVTIQSGEIMYFASSKAPLKDSEGNIIGVIGNSLDITKLKETEAALEAAKEKAEISDKAKSIFIQNMEHDIRTPFNGVWGFANILAEQETDSQKKEFLTCIANCAKELLDYCDSILDFSRIEHGAVPIIEKSFRIRELVDSIIKIESIAIKHKKLKFSCKYHDDLPGVTIGDPYRLKRILLNLVSNAIKFTEEGKISLSIELANITPEFRTCILKFIIEDTGIGIPLDKQNTIYEKFTRATPSNQGIYKGQGLGLRIVKQFITELEGEIHLQSEINKGSRFTLLIPFKLPLANNITDEEEIDI